MYIKPENITVSWEKMYTFQEIVSKDLFFIAFIVIVALSYDTDDS